VPLRQQTYTIRNADYFARRLVLTLSIVGPQISKSPTWQFNAAQILSSVLYEISVVSPRPNRDKALIEIPVISLNRV
jgi:hypothetical protein